tara:strand:+ start:91 stop:381 length:291 start_codon:yes stop_codon:yes gene_type:complete
MLGNPLARGADVEIPERWAAAALGPFIAEFGRHGDGFDRVVGIPKVAKGSEFKAATLHWSDSIGPMKQPGTKIIASLVEADLEGLQETGCGVSDFA